LVSAPEQLVASSQCTLPPPPQNAKVLQPTQAPHVYVLPSQVTLPGWPAAQLRFVDEQLLPEQLTEPPALPQLTEALQGQGSGHQVVTPLQVT